MVFSRFFVATDFQVSRYIFVEYPILSRKLCSVHNVRVSTLIITIVSLLCGLPKSLDYYYDVYEGWAYFPHGELKYIRQVLLHFEWNLSWKLRFSLKELWIEINFRSCLYDFTALVRFIGPNNFFNFYFWTRVLGFIILPSLLLIILNFLLIRGLRKAQKRKQRLLRLV